MATGRAATPDEVQYLLSLEGDGTWQPFFDLIDEYFTYLANQAGGIDKLVQQLAQNAFGLTLTDSQVEDVIPWFFSQGVDTWSKLVLWSIFNTDSLGQTLNQRADAADHLLQVLQQSNKADLFKGFMSTPEAVAQSVKSLIQSVGADAASLEAAQKASMPSFNRSVPAGSRITSSTATSRVPPSSSTRTATGFRIRENSPPPRATTEAIRCRSTRPPARSWPSEKLALIFITIFPLPVNSLKPSASNWL